MSLVNPTTNEIGSETSTTKTRRGILPAILMAVAVLVLVFIVVMALLPSDFRISRSKSITASPGAAFALVNDFHNWTKWSPWEKLDPAQRRDYEGKTSGVGSIFHWSGNDKVGEGYNTITDNRPNELIRMKLEFLRPFKATNTVEFTFEPKGDQTMVTWTMTGKYNLVTKVMCLFMSMDKMVGDSFDEGLTNLKVLLESSPPVSQ